LSFLLENLPRLNISLTRFSTCSPGNLSSLSVSVAVTNALGNATLVL
jgi:hypothetical protein